MDRRCARLVLIAAIVAASGSTRAEATPPRPESSADSATIVLRGPVTDPAVSRSTSTPALPKPVPKTIESPVSETYTLEALQSLALQRNPTLEQARAEIGRAHGQVVQAGLYPNPRAGYTSSDIGLEGTAGQQGVFVSQELVTGCKLPLRQAIFRADVDRAIHLVAEQEYRVVNSVRAEYYNVLATQRLREIATELVAVGEDVVETTQRRLDAMEGSRIDLLQARVALQESQLFQRTADRRHDAAWRRLEAVVGTPLPSRQLDGDLEAEAPDFEFEQALVRLLSTSPRVLQARANIVRARAALKRAGVQPIPNVTVQASTSYDFSTDDQIAGVQIGLPLPVRDRNQGNIRSAHAEYVRSARDLERLELELRRGLADAFREYDVARARAVAFKNEILPTTRDTLRLSRQAFDGGQLDYLQLLAVQREFTRANRNYVESLGEFWASVVTIDGLLLDDGLAAPSRVQGP